MTATSQKCTKPGCTEPRRSTWTWCKPHWNEYMREWSRTPAGRRQIRHNNLNRNGVKITLAEYDALHEKQGGLCAICNQPETHTHKGKLRPLCVDHDHQTGRIRGLLCSKCNQSIGLMQDNPDRLRAAADYLTWI